MSRVRQDILMSVGRQKSFSFSVPSATFLTTPPTWAIAKTPGGDILLSKTSGSGLTVVDNTTVTVVLTAGDIDDPGIYWHWLYLPNVELARGRLTARPAPG